MRLVGVVVVEADEGLADPEAQQDRQQDHGDEQRLDVAVPRLGHVARVKREREDSHSLRQQVAQLVGEAGACKALQIAEQAAPTASSVQVIGSSRKSA